MIVAVVGLACGVLLLVTADSTTSPGFFGGVAGIIVSMLWFYKSGILAFSVKQFEQHHLQRPAAIVRENQAKDNAADGEPPSPATFEKPIPTEVAREHLTNG